MSNRFYFGSDDDSSSNGSQEGLESLPYPKPLKHADFLTPTFNPTEYLSTLQNNRHQTLEDLRSELRTRSQDLNKELLDLVNHNYQDFLSLGSSLKGGDEKVEEVRLGLLGFKREIEALLGKVEERRGEIEGLVEEKKQVRERIQLGRQLLELDRRVGDLEVKLMLAPKPQPESHNDGEEGDGIEEDSEDDSEDSEDEDDAAIPVKRLRRRVQQYMLIRRLAEKLGLEHPFVVKQEERRGRLRQTLLLDMNSALKTAVDMDGEGREKQLFMMGTYKMMGEWGECMEVLREAKGGLKAGNGKGR